MRNVTHRSLQATTVIAAVLALGSTPALAQDASAPMIDSPPAASAQMEAPAPAPAEAPTLTTAPPQIAVPDVSAPVSQPAAAQAPEAVAPRASVARTERHVVRETARAETKSPIRTEEAQSTVKPVATLAAAPAPVAAVPPAAKTLSDKDAFNSGSRVGNANQSGDDVKSAPLLPGDSGMVAGGIVVVLGLGAAAMLASRRRKAAGEAYEPVDAVEPVAPASAVAEPAFAVEEPAPLVRAPAPLARAASGPLPVGEEREALVQAMVEAAPDAENPFTSGKARRHRARLILQAREQHQQEAEQRFDFRKYQSPVRAAGADAHRIPTPVA